jgi:hypothetical protein
LAARNGPFFEIPAEKEPDDCFVFLEEAFNLEDQFQAAIDRNTTE